MCRVLGCFPFVGRSLKKPSLKLEWAKCEEDLDTLPEVLLAKIEEDTSGIQSDLEKLVSHKVHLKSAEQRIALLKDRAGDTERIIKEMSLQANRLQQLLEEQVQARDAENSRLVAFEEKMMLTKVRKKELTEEMFLIEKRIDERARNVTNLRQILDRRENSVQQNDVYFDACETFDEYDCLLEKRKPSMAVSISTTCTIPPSDSSHASEKCELHVWVEDLHIEKFSGKTFSLELDSITSMLEAFTNSSISYLIDETSTWNPTSNTSKILSKRKNHKNTTLEKEVFVWSKTVNNGLHGYNIPMVKARGNVPTDARTLIDLLLDSSRTKEYNKMSLSRTEEHVFQKGVDTNGRYGPGETKVMRSRNKVPMVTKPLENHVLCHARYVEDLRGYVMVTRTVFGDSSGELKQGGEVTSCEMYLGASLVREIDTGEQKMVQLTAITHIFSPLVPLFVAKRVGLTTASNYIRDVQAAFDSS